MNSQEKALARKFFKLKIHEANGQKFENIFTAIMNYAESDFQQIKPWGNIGDRKNDGYIKSKGIFFQVFAPEDIHKSQPDVINKLEKDFECLKSQWENINEFYFVVNDKYNGVNADCEQKIQQIKTQHKLQNAGFKTSKDLENILFNLQDDQILAITGHLSDPGNIKTLDYSILNEVISHIKGLPLTSISDSSIIVPDWDEKVKFNDLSELPLSYLNHGYLQIGAVESYLKNESNFLADELKEKMYQLYITEKDKNQIGNDLFWAIVNQASPKSENPYQAAVIVIMAKYFETCDIFEEPIKEQKQ